ncbi:MAG: diaminopimelate decarboxylase, partial [Gammaproteobacteria bacterium]
MMQDRYDLYVRIAQKYGTPCYIYSRSHLTSAYQTFDAAFGGHPHQICYAVKANSNLAILNTFARLGAGFDIVSVGELERVIAAGGDPKKVIFAGIGKRTDEIERALQVEIQCFNVESRAELARINQIAGRLGVVAPIALRVNPDIEAGAHPYISTGLKENKFGIDMEEARHLYQTHQKDFPHVRMIGIASHIGSQILEPEPFLEALDRMLSLGVALEHIDIGGGFGVQYHDETVPSPKNYLAPLLQKTNQKIIIEPGRALVASSGVLVTRVEYLKRTAHKNFAIVDAAMNDLMRPVLYDAWHDIVPVSSHIDIKPEIYDVVGPICETADFLGKARRLAIKENDLLIIKTAGAYG